MNELAITIRYHFPPEPDRLTGRTAAEVTSPRWPHGLVVPVHRTRRKNDDGTWRIVYDGLHGKECATWDEAVRLVHQHAYAFALGTSG